MRKNLHKISFYTLILAVYGIFFSIQSFYNFEGHSDAREILRHAAFLPVVSSGSGVKAIPAAHPDSHRVRLRLNKRFHQEEFPPCTVYEVCVPVIYVTPHALGPFAIRPLPAVTLFHPQLRGPPYIA
ncbi:MAG TPA: hypothetical protein VKQ52_17240 [Puia sp.]|nr:hypothetical protein [Puia sp.]